MTTTITTAERTTAKATHIKVGQKVKYLVTRTLQTVKAYRPARKDHFGDILTPATIVFETPDGTCWDNAENFEALPRD